MKIEEILNKKLKRGRRATRLNKTDPTIRVPRHYLTSQKLFGSLVLGKQSYFVIGSENAFLKKWGDKLIGHDIYILVHKTTILKLTATVVSITRTDDSDYYTRGVRGDMMIVQLKNIRPTPFSTYFAKRYLGDKLVERKAKKKDKELKIRIRSAFRDWDLGDEYEEE